MWEEPCISEKKGSGAFFSLAAACGAVSARTGILPLGIPEKKFQWSGLLKFFLELQEKGAANLNLVTGAHYVPHIISALELARGKGMNLPVVYNSSGYESVETIRRLDGYVDVYLPDMKYMEPELAAAFSNARDYPQAAQSAIAEMMRQTGSCQFAEDGYIKTRDNCSSSDFARAYQKFYCSIEISVPDLWGGYFYQRNEPIYACLEE